MIPRRFLKNALPPAAHLWLRAFYARRKRSLSQLGQDAWVMGEATNGKRGGYFLEVGSADGIFLNNTFLLEQRFGWKGICVEPNPLQFIDLRRVRKADCVQACLDTSEGEVPFIQRGQLGGIVGDDTDNRTGLAPAPGETVVMLRTTTLLALLRSRNAPKTVDYFSLDVEGSEGRILSEFPFAEYTFNLMTIERPKASLRDLLSRNGYRVVREVPHHDVFYVHESYLPAYEENVFQYWGRNARPGGAR